MEYIMGKQLLDMPVNMKIVKMLSTINEYKGQQIVYKKQPKDILEELMQKAIIDFTIDSCDQNSLSEDRKMELFYFGQKPETREEVNIVEFKDVLRTVNNAYEDMKISSQTILELHGYLHRFSLKRGGKYRTEENDFLQTDFFRENNNGVLIKRNIEERLEIYIDELCADYDKLIVQNEIDTLVIIATFILDFILISPFADNNIKMAKLLTLLLLNKNGYEVGRYCSLGNIFDEKTQIYFRGLFTRKSDSDDDERIHYSINKWLEYFLTFILNEYTSLASILNLNAIKKETKTKRIEKIVNSTLGYFTKDDIRMQCPDIPEPTINRVFNNLRKDGKIEVVAKGRSAKWKRI